MFYIVFTASGFAGLIYESIWTNYLKLFLGHAAYAQALVLAVFMSGMAIGSLLCAKYSERFSNLLIGYALIEAVIGICAVLFHPLFVQFVDIAYAKLIPALGSPAAVGIFKWAAAAMLILPQTILLGMTFPLMTAGLIRRSPNSPGTIVAMLYFTNSIGAATGVLVAGFLSIGWVGLPGTLVIAGCINIIVAALVWLENNKSGFQSDILERSLRLKTAPPRSTQHDVYKLFLLVALLTGLSSFIYEIGWIRMLSLVLGSSTHAFELMLSAFITGIAFGGLWIKKRIDTLYDPMRFLAIVQIIMGIMALATLPLYAGSFNIMAWLMKNLPKSETGYLLFNLSSSGFAIVIMLPAAFCAGMTLPLITTILLRQGAGERSVGAVYGFNTIGSILGVFTAIHLAMPLLGLKGMIILGAVIDIGLGIVLALRAISSWRVHATYATIVTGALLLSIFWLKLDPDKMASGVYRLGRLLDPKYEETLFHKDGKTATVSVTRYSLPDGKQDLSIRTNGKSDASIRVVGGGHAVDEDTMVLLGTLGTILYPEAHTSAVIGWGSGLSTHALLTSPNIKSVDTIEIEPLIVRAAALYGSRVHLAYDDPRSHVQIEDAKSFFSFSHKKYDLIISEPSNPWVSGVGSLFTAEFYSRVKNYVNKDGLFIQWLHLYEIDIPLVVSILNALEPSFSDYVIYAPNLFDIIIVASPSGIVPKPRPSFMMMKDLSAELKDVGISSLQDIDIRTLGNKRALAPFFDSFAIISNSDYFPIVDLYAVRSRFFETDAFALFYNSDFKQLPAIQMLGKEPLMHDFDDITFSDNPKTMALYTANAAFHYLMTGQWKWGHPENPISSEIIRDAELARRVLMGPCSSNMLEKEWWDAQLRTIAFLVPYLSPEQLEQLFQRINTPSCVRHYSSSQRDFVSLLKAVGKQDPAHMARYAENLLKDPKAVDADLLKYALSAGMLGSLSSGKIQDAQLLWKTYGPRLTNENRHTPMIRFLVSHAYKGGNNISDLLTTVSIAQ